MSEDHQEKQPDKPLQPGQTQIQNAEHDAVMAQVFRQDPSYAVALINSLLEQGHLDELVITLNQLAKAFGQESEQDDPGQAQLEGTGLESGKPEISSLAAMLKAIGLRRAVG